MGKDSKVEGPAIGIDLGTTYSCVGIWQNDRVEIIANDQGNRTTPSFVAFTDSERMIGDAAKNQAAMNPVNTVFDAKRLIGRRFTESATQSDIKHFPFKVIAKDGDRPCIVVENTLGKILGWENLDKAPQILLGICGTQLFMLAVAIFLGFGNERCYIYVPEGGDILIDCNQCSDGAGLLWRDWFVFFVGLAAISLGIYGALNTDQEKIRWYAYSMMCFAFIVGLSCVLTAFEIPILHDAQDANQAQLSMNPQCSDTIDAMVSYTRNHAILYGINCALEIGGALFAMWSNVYFDYEQVQIDHENTKSYGSGL